MSFKAKLIISVLVCLEMISKPGNIYMKAGISRTLQHAHIKRVATKWRWQVVGQQKAKERKPCQRVNRRKLAQLKGNYREGKALRVFGHVTRLGLRRTIGCISVCHSF